MLEALAVVRRDEAGINMSGQLLYCSASMQRDKTHPAAERADWNPGSACTEATTDWKAGMVKRGEYCWMMDWTAGLLASICRSTMGAAVARGSTAAAEAAPTTVAATMAMDAKDFMLGVL